ncbi:pilin [Patescibacteria group bacterium]|nr:pilin [Patescibacteria group bacterium]
MIKYLLNIGVAKAQELIQCADGTMADPTIGCVETPSALINPQSNLAAIILNFASGLMTFVAGVAVLTLIYGGIRYAMAAGSDEQINKAKRIMFWGGFGLIVGLLAQFVAKFIVGIIG